MHTIIIVIILLRILSRRWTGRMRGGDAEPVACRNTHKPRPPFVAVAAVAVVVVVVAVLVARRRRRVHIIIILIFSAALRAVHGPVESAFDFFTIRFFLPVFRAARVPVCECFLPARSPACHRCPPSPSPPTQPSTHGVRARTAAV